MTHDAFNAALRRRGFKPHPNVFKNGYLTRLKNGKRVTIIVKIQRPPRRRNILKALIGYRHQLETTDTPVGRHASR